MGKLRIISLLLLIMGFVFSTSSCATQGKSSHRSNMGVKKSRHKSGHRKNARHRAKAHHKKYKSHPKNPILRHG